MVGYEGIVCIIGDYSLVVMCPLDKAKNMIFHFLIMWLFLSNLLLCYRGPIKLFVKYNNDLLFNFTFLLHVLLELQQI